MKKKEVGIINDDDFVLVYWEFTIEKAEKLKQRLVSDEHVVEIRERLIDKPDDRGQFEKIIYEIWMR